MMNTDVLKTVDKSELDCRKIEGANKLLYNKTELHYLGHYWMHLQDITARHITFEVYFRPILILCHKLQS